MSPKQNTVSDNNSGVLLVEANDMSRWIGGHIPFEVHILPIGLMYLASYARKMFPHRPYRIIETSLQTKSDDAYVKVLEDFKPALVGIRSINFFFKELERIVALTKANSNALLVAGGPVVQALGRQLLSKLPDIDVAVKGEGESTLARILSGEQLECIPGIFYRVGDQVIENDDVQEITDIDEIPFPAYDLIDLELYQRQLSYAYNYRRQGILLTSRGCVFNCTFCFSHWKTVRLRSADNIFKEIATLYKDYEIRDYYIIDDMFNINRERALSLFDRIVAAGLQLRLYFANGLRADRIDPEFIDRAIDAGAIWFTYAIESANPLIQALVKKRVDLNKAHAAISYTQQRGVGVNISTMYGFPRETPEQANETLDWLGTLPKPSLLPYHFCLRLFPGCEIVQQALDAGWNAETFFASSSCSYNDLPIGTPTFPRSKMLNVILQYHDRFGLNNKIAIKDAFQTLRTIGYSDHEILSMYSLLKRKVIDSVEQLLS